jgi:hypothetical protein
MTWKHCRQPVCHNVLAGDVLLALPALLAHLLIERFIETLPGAFRERLLLVVPTKLHIFQNG